MINLHEKQSVRGTIKYTVYKNGVPIEHCEDHNLVVDTGRHRLAQLSAGDSTKGVAKFGVGTGTDTEQSSDTYLKNQYTNNIVGHTVDGADAIFEWCLDETEYNGYSVSEFGLFDSDGVMLTHQVRGASIGKLNDTRIKGSYTLHF